MDKTAGQVRDEMDKRDVIAPHLLPTSQKALDGVDGVDIVDCAQVHQVQIVRKVHHEMKQPQRGGTKNGLRRIETDYNGEKT